MVQVVIVFGGTGFLGRRVVRHVRDKEFSVRIASRRPKRSGDDDPQLRSISADIHGRQSIAAAVEGAFGVVNAVSLYVEQKPSLRYMSRQRSEWPRRRAKPA